MVSVRTRPCDSSFKYMAYLGPITLWAFTRPNTIYGPWTIHSPWSPGSFKALMRSRDPWDSSKLHHVTWFIIYELVKWHFPLATFSFGFIFGFGFFSELLFVSRLSLVVVGFSTRLVAFRTSGGAVVVSRDCWICVGVTSIVSPFVVVPLAEPFFFEIDFSTFTRFWLVEAGFGLSFMASMRLRRCGTHVAVTPAVTKMAGKSIRSNNRNLDSILDGPNDWKWNDRSTAFTSQYFQNDRPLWPWPKKLTGLWSFFGCIIGLIWRFLDIWWCYRFLILW